MILSRTELNTISRDLGLPFLVMIGSACIFLTILMCISNIFTHPVVIMASKVNEDASGS
jgi:hypothetical protein